MVIKHIQAYRAELHINKMKIESENKALGCNRLVILTRCLMWILEYQANLDIKQYLVNRKTHCFNFRGTSLDLMCKLLHLPDTAAKPPTHKPFISNTV